MTSTSTPTTVTSDSVSASERGNPNGGSEGFRVPNLGHTLAGEFTRLIGLRSVLVYAILLTGAIYGPTVLVTAFSDTDSTALFIGSDFFLFIAMIFAAADSASAISSRNVAYGYLTRHGRWTGHAARLIAQIVTVLAMLAIGSAIAALVLGIGGVEFMGSMSQAGVVIALAVAWTAISSGIGMLIPVTAAAVATPILWVAMIEGILPILPFGEFMGEIEQFLPWVAGRQLLGYMDLGIGDAQAWIVLGVWTAVITAAGLVVSCRRDIR